MKKHYFILNLLLACLNVNAVDSDVLHIVGNLRHFEDYLYVQQFENWKYVKGDSFAVNNGKIDVLVQMEKPRLLRISGRHAKTDKNGYFEYIQIIGVPGETLQLVGTLDNYTVLGSKFYQQSVEMNEAIKPFENEYNALVVEYRKMMKDEIKGEMLNQCKEKIEQKRSQISSAIISFAKAHPDNEATVIYLSRLPYDQYDNYLNMLTPAVRDGRMKAFYQPELDFKKASDENKKHLEDFKSRVVGSEVPDFTLTDINGMPLSISSLRGKYVVLDFWGTWCGPCVNGMPKMKKYYEKYKGKYEILGIDCNDSEEKWKSFVIEKGLPWLHVYNKNDDNDVRKNLGVYAYPTKLIIDPQGKIINLFVGETNDFYTYLDKLFY